MDAFSFGNNGEQPQSEPNPMTDSEDVNQATAENTKTVVEPQSENATKPETEQAPADERAQTLADNGCTYASGRGDPSYTQSDWLHTPVNSFYTESKQQDTPPVSTGYSYQNPYSSYGARTPYTAPTQQKQYNYTNYASEPAGKTAPTAEDKPKKEKQVRRKNPVRFGTYVALVLVCLVTGTLSGSVSSYLVTKNILEQVPSSSAVQSSTQSQSGMQIDIYDHSGETASTQPSTQPATEAPSETTSVQSASDNGAGAGTVSSASAVYKDNVDSVVNIIGKGTQTVSFGFFFGGNSTQEFTSSGTGFLLTPDGYILTNYHVVEGCSSLSVTDYNGSEYPAKLVGYEESNDIAVLKVDGDSFHSVTLGDSDTLEVGDSLMIIGNALGELNYSLTTGVVSYLQRSVTTETGSVINMFQTDAAINSGNSGGPVFNNKGEVVGIASAKYASSTIEGLGFCIPIDDVKDMILDIIDVGYVTGKPSLGLSLYTNAVASRTIPRGCYVVAVGSATAADKAGIAVGDVITAINGTAIREVDDVATVLSSLKAGETVTVSLTRNGSALDVQVTLDEYTPSSTARTSYTNVYDY